MSRLYRKRSLAQESEPRAIDTRTRGTCVTNHFQWRPRQHPKLAAMHELFILIFFFIITFSRDGFSGLYKAPSSLSIDPAKHKYIENKRTLRWMTVADNCRDINRRAAEEGINNWKGVIVLCAVNRLQVSTRCQGYCITHEKVIRERRWWSTTNIWNRLEHIDLSTSCLVCVSFTLYLR